MEVGSSEISSLTKALHRAVKVGRVKKVKSLLRRGANVNEGARSRQTALSVAFLYKNSQTLRIINILLKSGADVNVEHAWPITPLYEACCLNSRSEVTDGNNQTNQNLTRQSRKSNMQNVRLINMLLRFGAKVNVQNFWGRTPLHYACLSGNHRAVMALLRNGAKLDLVDSDGKTALHFTCSMNATLARLRAVKALLAVNVNVDSEEGFPPNSSHNSKEARVVDIVNLKDTSGNTALHLACKNKNKEVVSLLLRKGAKVGVKNKYGRTALHSAAEGYATDVVDVLLDNGEDVNAKDHYGNTPLHLFCSLSPDLELKHLSKLVDNMLSRGAFDSEQNNDLEMPLDSLTSRISTDNEHLFGMDLSWKISETVLKHSIKRKMLQSQVGFDWHSVDSHLNPTGLLFCHSLKDRCFKEVELMKSTRIVKEKSLYGVFSQTNKPYFLSTDDLLHIDEFLCSPDLFKKFPLYGHALRTTFQRSKLLTLAVQSFYTEGRKQMVKMLPIEVTELIVTYLTNEDLRNFKKSE